MCRRQCRFRHAREQVYIGDLLGPPHGGIQHSLMVL
ncbi:Uncharacterised protein [Vibrio cholerae]|nr:Uncharacterised protein [Vibrio cholerae]